MKRSVEFLEGYNACARGISRPHNPYLEDLKLMPDDHDENHARYNAWRDGWNKRFYGEEILSEP